MTKESWNDLRRCFPYPNPEAQRQRRAGYRITGKLLAATLVGLALDTGVVTRRHSAKRAIGALRDWLAIGANRDPFTGDDMYWVLLRCAVALGVQL